MKLPLLRGIRTRTGQHTKVKTLLIITLYIAFALFTYAPDYGWWISLVGSAIVLIVGKFAFGSEWRSKLELAATTREIAIATTHSAFSELLLLRFFSST